MTAEEFVIWLKGFGEGMSFNNVSFLDAWQTIDAVMENIEPQTPPEPDFSAPHPPLYRNQQVTPGSDVVDTDNNWKINPMAVLTKQGLKNLKDSE